MIKLIKTTSIRLNSIRRNLSSSIIAKPHRTHLPTSSTTPLAHTFYHNPSGAFTYIIVDSSTSSAVLIDPTLDFNPITNEIKTDTTNSLLNFIKQEGLNLTHILETHAHADHITSSQFVKRVLKKETGIDVPVCIGERIIEVQELWRKRYGMKRNEIEGVFDILWKDDEQFKMGNLNWTVRHLPGHTPDHVGYQAGDFIFCGDSLFLPDVGSARADFPGGSSSALFESSQKLLSLPPTTRIFSGHDYVDTKERLIPSCSSTVEEQKLNNKHVKVGIGMKEFIKMREERDKGLSEPKVLWQALQINIRAGHFPSDGLIRLPLKLPEGFLS